MLSLAQHHREGCGHRIWGEGRNAGSCASMGPGVGAVCRTGSQSPHQLGRSALCLQGAWTQARVLSGEARPVQGTEPEAGGGTSFRISRMRKDVCGVLAYFLLDSSPVQWGWGLGSQWPCRVAEGRVCVLGAVSSRWPPLVQPLDTQEHRSGPLQVPASLNRARGPVCQKPRTVGQQQRERDPGRGHGGIPWSHWPPAGRAWWTPCAHLCGSQPPAFLSSGVRGRLVGCPPRAPPARAGQPRLLLLPASCRSPCPAWKRVSVRPHPKCWGRELRPREAAVCVPPSPLSRPQRSPPDASAWGPGLHP